MPLIIGTIYLFGQILSFALPVSLLIAFATFFYRQARKVREAVPRATSPPSTVTAATATTTTAAPESPVAPSRPSPDR